jgi:nitrite reductase/ring-hydroxylating ferredoxin subunit/uncharacterized membrane protein
MSEDAILRFAEQQEWLAPIQKAGEEFVKKTYESAGPAGQAIKNALHGVWLGHPLHSAITDVPVGSWTAAAVMDALEASGNEDYAPGADAAIAIGLAGAVGSALTGLTDWSDTYGKPQRVGTLHGLLNITAAVLYTGSYIARKNRNRGLGRALAFTGFGIVLASAWLGGALSYRQRIGVDHSPDVDNELPEDFKPAIADSELAEGQPTKATVDGTDIFLLKRGNQIFALANRCAHEGGPLNEGKIEDNSVICPWHGSRFCMKTGKVLDGPAVHPQPKLDVQVRHGQVLVRRSQATTGPDIG